MPTLICTWWYFAAAQQKSSISQLTVDIVHNDRLLFVCCTHSLKIMYHCIVSLRLDVMIALSLLMPQELQFNRTICCDIHLARGESSIRVGEQVFERVVLASLQEKLYHFYSWSKQPNVTTVEVKQSINVLVFFQTSVDNAIAHQQKFNLQSRHDNEQPILVKSVIRWGALHLTRQFQSCLLGFGLIFMLVTVNGYTPAWRARWAALTALMSSRLARARLCDPRRRLANL